MRQRRCRTVHSRRIMPEISGTLPGTPGHLTDGAGSPMALSGGVESKPTFFNPCHRVT